jgi:transcriptional regulator with XRE-family HTH domain
MDDMQRLAGNLLAARKAKNMSMQDLADKANVAKATVFVAEAAQHEIGAVKLYRMAKALKTNVNKLFQ